MFPILNHPPTSLHIPSLRVIPVHRSQASCIEPGLAIHFLYDIIHVSVPFPQIVLHFPSPAESKRLFYKFVSLLLSHIQGYRYHLSKFHIYVFTSVQFRSVAQWCPTLCDLMNLSTPGPTVHHQFPGFTQTQVH